MQNVHNFLRRHRPWRKVEELIQLSALQYFTPLPYSEKEEFVASPYVIHQNGVLFLYTLENRVEAVSLRKEILKYCETKKLLEDLILRFGKTEVGFLISQKILKPVHLQWNHEAVRYVEIETSRLCNWKCEYCPVSQSPRHQKAMSMELFRDIVSKVTRHRTVQYVTFNGYSEPTLDPLFEERLKTLAERRIKLKLHTNGTGLTPKRLHLLKNLGIVYEVFFNLPSVDEKEFMELTGARSLDDYLQKIDLAIKLRLPVFLSIQNRNYASNPKTLEKIRNSFKHLPTSIEFANTTDRAGSLKNHYHRSVSVEGPLFGCAVSLDWMQIDVDGTCLLCCEDFHGRFTYGKVQDGEIIDVINSPAAQEMRKKVFGATNAEPDFLCRTCTTMTCQKNRFGIH